VTHKNSGNDQNETEVLVEIPVPARFRASDRKEFLRNFEPRAAAAAAVASAVVVLFEPLLQLLLLLGGMVG
jgi:hypothetical protein